MREKLDVYILRVNVVVIKSNFVDLFDFSYKNICMVKDTHENFLNHIEIKSLLHVCSQV